MVFMVLTILNTCILGCCVVCVVWAEWLHDHLFGS